MNYEIHPEFYVSPENFYEGKRCPSIEFHYSIRREDGSLVFRTESHEYASEILSNLRHPKREPIAA